MKLYVEVTVGIAVEAISINRLSSFCVYGVKEKASDGILREGFIEFIRLGLAKKVRGKFEQ